MITKVIGLILAALCTQLEVTQLSGFGVGRAPLIVPFTGTATQNLVLCTYLQGLGYDVTAGTRQIQVVLANGTIIGSVPNNNATPLISFQTGNCGGSWSTWQVRIVVRAGNSARIQGHGGYGGAVEAALGEEAQGGGEDGLAFVLLFFRQGHRAHARMNIHSAFQCQPKNDAVASSLPVCLAM